MGQNHRIIKSGLHSKDYYADLWRTIANGKVWRGEFCNRAKDGSLYWVYATIFPIMGEDGKPKSYMGVRYDMTERKRLEEELHRSNRALEEFDHIVAHELKTPLTVIKMAAENLTSAGMGPLNPNQERTLGMINNNAGQLAATINSLLRMAQFSTVSGGLKLKSLDAKLYIDKVIQNLQGVAQERNINICASVPAGLPCIKSSSESFSEILTNLLSNAMRYAACKIVVEARALPEWVQFCVHDDGPGISKERLAGLFEKFSSDNHLQSPLFQGSGLGLYICKELLHQVGGKIWVESNEGHGARFCFTLPIDRSESPAT